VCVCVCRYGVESQLLVDLSKAGHGQYLFIPDASFVGCVVVEPAVVTDCECARRTAFVNGIANELTTIGQRAVLTLTPTNGASFVDGAKSATHALGNLTADTPKHVVARMRVPAAARKGGEFVRAQLTYSSIGASGTQITSTLDGTSSEGGTALQRHLLRTSTVALLEQTVASCGNKTDTSASTKAARAKVDELARTHETSQDAFVQRRV
jgi:hypothetical protein